MAIAHGPTATEIHYARVCAKPIDIGVANALTSAVDCSDNHLIISLISFPTKIVAYSSCHF